MPARISTPESAADRDAEPGALALGCYRLGVNRLRTALSLVAVVAVCGCDRGDSPDTDAPESTHQDPSMAPQHDGPRADHKHHGGMTHRFQDAEAWAKQFDNPERDGWQKPDTVLEFVALEPTEHIADVGAGTGYFAVRFASRAAKVLAVDLEPDMVEYLTQRAAKEGLDNLSAQLGQAEGPALSEPVDVVFLCNTYHHVADRPAYFAKVAASLKEGGRLVLVDFKPDAPPETPGPPPKHRVSIDQVQAELKGWELTRSDVDSLPYQYLLEFKPKG